MFSQLDHSQIQEVESLDDVLVLHVLDWVKGCVEGSEVQSMYSEVMLLLFQRI